MRRLLINPRLNVGIRFILSIIISYSLWNIIGIIVPRTAYMLIPVCITDTNANHLMVEHPYSTTIGIRSSYHNIRRLSSLLLTASFDSSRLTEGTHHISLTHNILSLPKTYELVHYEPLPITIQSTLR